MKIEEMKSKIMNMDARLNGKWMLEHLPEIAERVGGDVNDEKGVMNLLDSILLHCIFVYPAKAVEEKDYSTLKKIVLIQEGYDPEKDYDKYYQITGTTKDDLHYLIDDPDVLHFRVNDMYVYSI